MSKDPDPPKNDKWIRAAIHSRNQFVQCREPYRAAPVRYLHPCRHRFWFHPEESTVAEDPRPEIPYCYTWVLAEYRIGLAATTSARDRCSSYWRSGRTLSSCHRH